MSHKGHAGQLTLRTIMQRTCSWTQFQILKLSNFRNLPSSLVSRVFNRQHVIAKHPAKLQLLLWWHFGGVRSEALGGRQEGGFQ